MSDRYSAIWDVRVERRDSKGYETFQLFVFAKSLEELPWLRIYEKVPRGAGPLNKVSLEIVYVKRIIQIPDIWDHAYQIQDYIDYQIRSRGLSEKCPDA